MHHRRLYQHNCAYYLLWRWVNLNILFSFPSCTNQTQNHQDPDNLTPCTTLRGKDPDWPCVCWVLKMWASHRPTGATNHINVAVINVMRDTCVKYLWESHFTHANAAVSVTVQSWSSITSQEDKGRWKYLHNDLLSLLRRESNCTCFFNNVLEAVLRC